MQADLVQPHDPRASIQTQPAYYYRDDADPEAMDTDDVPAATSRGFRSDAFDPPTGPRNPGNGNARRQEPRRNRSGGGGGRQQQAAPTRSLLDRLSVRR